MLRLVILFLLIFLASCSSEDNFEQSNENQSVQETSELPDNAKDDSVVSDEGDTSSDSVVVAEIIENEEDSLSYVDEAQNAEEKPMEEAVSDRDLLVKDQINIKQESEVKEVL